MKRLQSIIDERRRGKEQEVPVQHHDVLEAMMNNVDEDGRPLTDEEMIDTLIVYLLAGHESSAHTGMWIMILLYQNPDVWQKALVSCALHLRLARSSQEFKNIHA